MKLKTSELEGALLDVAVALAEGGYARVRELADPELPAIEALRSDGSMWKPSQSWADAAEIIERECISMQTYGDGVCVASVKGFRPPGDSAAVIEDWRQVGSTCLTAAMRSFVLYKLGPEIEATPSPNVSEALLAVIPNERRVALYRRDKDSGKFRWVPDSNTKPSDYK